MDSLPQYILQVCAAAILCSIAIVLLGDKGTIGSIGKLVTGLLLAITVAAPIAGFEFRQITGYLDGLQFQANAYTEEGQALAREEIAAVIKQRVEEYIRDKAADLGVQLEVTATVKLEDSFRVERVILQGAVSPLQKQKLQQMMENDLEISKERQQWTQ